jgi:hypothetical protein
MKIGLCRALTTEDWTTWTRLDFTGLDLTLLGSVRLEKSGLNQTEQNILY